MPGKQITMADLVESHVLEIMRAQQYMDKETAEVGDHYGYALANMRPELRKFFKTMIPPRPVISKTLIDLNVTVSRSKKSKSEIQVKLLSLIEVAGIKRGKTVGKRIGNRIKFELYQIPYHWTNEERRQNHE